MLKNVLILLVSLSVMSYSAEEDECLHGKIVAADTREPLEGVEVYTNKLPDTVKTNAQGEFRFERCVSVKNFFNKNIKGEPFFRGNTIFFDIRESETFVKLNIYNLNGKLLKSIINKKLPANSYSFKIPVSEISTSASVCIINLQIGNRSFSQQLVLGKNGVLNSGEIKNLKNRGVNREQIKNAEESEVIDYLFFNKKNFKNLSIPLYSYKGRIDTALIAEDTIPPKIEKFLWPDTAWYDVGDSLVENGGWLKFWFFDSIIANIQFSDNEDAFLRPSNNTTERHPGFYEAKFLIEDYSSNFTEKKILLVLYDSTIIDTIPPTISVVPETLVVTKGEKISLRSGVTVKDNIDTNISLINHLNIIDNITSTKGKEGPNNDNIILDVPGTYTVTYKIIDTHMNLAEKKRIIIVKDTEGSE